MIGNVPLYRDTQNLCFAYDQENRSHLVVREVVRRDIDCALVLRQEDIPVRHIAGTQSGTIQTGGTKIENNTDPSCEGIEITGVGEDMFRGLVTVKYVNIKNASDKRKKVLLDIKYDIKGRLLTNVYQEEIWEEYGPITTQPGEEGQVIVSRGDPSHEKRQIVAIRVVECS